MAKRMRQTRLPGMDDPQAAAASGQPHEPPAILPVDSFQVTPAAPDTQPEEAPFTTDEAQEVVVEELTEAAKERSEPEADAGPPSLEGKTVYLIDSHSLIFQVFHAIPEMSSPRGEPVNATFGFTRDLLFLIKEKKPDFLIAAFDLPGPTFRHDLYTEYKAHRDEMPDPLRPQLGQIREVLAALAVPVLEREGLEADDVLAAVAKQAEALGAKVFVVTTDKDCRQLLSDRVKLFNVRKNQVYDEAALLADWGVTPGQVVDFQAMVGDPVDNIPGVPLIGPKIAGQLLAQYGDLDSILANAEKMPAGKRRDNLMQGAERVALSRQLVRLLTEADIAVDWSAAKVGGVDVEAGLELCRRFGFRKIAGDFQSLEGMAVRKSAPPPKWEHDYQLVADLPTFETFFAELVEQPCFSFDTETTSIHPRRAEVVGYAFCWKPGRAYYVAVRGPEGEPTLDPDWVLQRLKPVLENPNQKKIGQNLKYDAIVMRTAGVRLAGVEFDTMVASYLLGAGERTHNLDDLALRYLQHTTTKIDALIGTGKNQKRMDEVPTALTAHYAAEDADVPWRLRPLLEQELEQAGLTKLNQTLETPLVEVLAELEYTGIRVDPQRLGVLSVQFGERMAELETQIHALAGKTFNIGSPKQLQVILFEELKLPVVKRGQTGPSTDADVLEELSRLHPLPAKIVEYRQYAKLKGTYVDALPALIHPVTGRVHASFNQVVAATGRLSSSDPNLQNIPIRTDEGREIRSAFLPEEGWKLLTADYSQIELRVLAHYSQDPALCQAFADDLDVHALVAAQVNDVPLEEVTSAMRRQAKAVNFGVVYGQSAFGLSKQLGIPQDEAQRFIDGYFARYPGVETFLNQVLTDAQANGFVTTMLGRRRTIDGVRPTRTRQRNLAERTAINTVIQGSAADLIKLAMLALHRRLQTDGLSARMLLQIHDELVFEVPPAELDQVSQLVSEVMTTVLPLSVPLKVDMASGLNWLDVE